MNDKPKKVIIARKTSKILEEQMTVAGQLKAKKERLEKKITRLIDQINDQKLLQSWTEGDVIERQEQLKAFSVQLEKVYEDALIELEDQDDLVENEALSDKTLTAKAKLFDRLKAITIGNASQVDNASIDKNNIKIEVTQTDATGNIPNIWGKFDGDYSKWKSFHDKWVASMHSNDKVKTIVKFQNLQAACVGAAKGALGEWDLTDDNYHKAWERLQTIFEDDYMQVQSFMQKLTDLPRINGSSSKTIRNTVDTVQKHIHGLQRYISIDENHPYVVFAVIGKMDTETYRAWEKHRPTLAKANAARNGGDPDNARPGKYIPTWKELEMFLENEVTIRVHAERHPNYETSARNDVQTFRKQQKRFNKHNNVNKNDDTNTHMPECPICEGPHRIYKCQSFIDMNLISRQNQVTEHELCVRCLQKMHQGRCANKRSNLVCPKCLPENKHHNSMLCPNAKAQSNAVMKATGEQRKRKGYEDKQSKFAKRRRYNDHPKQDRPHSVINKVGEWSLVAKQSNAIKEIKQAAESKFEKIVLLATLNMRFQPLEFIESVICRAIADMGATLNCVTRKFVMENELPTMKCQKRILGVSGPEIIKQKIKAIIRPWFNSKFAIIAEFFVLKQLDGKYPDKKINVAKEEIMHLGLADQNFDTPAPIDALIGAETYADIILPGLYKHKDGAIMQSTKLGHIILGRFIVKKYSSDLTVLNVIESNNVSEIQIKETKNEELLNALAKFWEIEAIDKIETEVALHGDQAMVEEIFMRTHYREPNGRYVVEIPMKPNHKGLGDSKLIAKKQFMQLERRFRRNAELKQKYIEYIREQIKVGYMQLATTPKEGELCYYLPHHPVTKKFRVVLNASAPTSNGESLNSIQMVGPKLQYDSQLQIMRFRRHKYAVATDIVKMFNKVGLNPKQWNLQRLFWRESENEQLKEYVMTVVIFGGASSAYNAVRAMIQCAKDYAKNYPQASDIIMKSFYMDDGVFGCDNTAELKILCKEVEFVLNQGHFSLKGWASNSEEVERYLNAPSQNEVAIGVKDEEKILGLRWLKDTDELSITVKLNDVKAHITKRSILSEIAKLYDPNGFIAPIVVKAKMLMQRIWLLKELKWDDNVPFSISKEWAEIYADLPLLSTFKIKRWLATIKGCKIQIHGFCDASKKAYGISIYVRAVNERQEVFCSLLSGKSKVAPLTGTAMPELENKTKPIQEGMTAPTQEDPTTPRLELLAAVMLSEQLKTVIQACELEEADVTLWSDSMIVMHWLRKHPSELKAFVSNRVRKIQELTKNYKWKHVISDDNPADLVSRGMNMRDFLKSKKWLEGPAWLKQAEETWPVPKLVVSPEEMEGIKSECKPKVPKAQIFNIFSGTEDAALYHKFQSWDKILNITVYVLRFIQRIRKKDDFDSLLITGRYVTSDERRNAIKFWIKYEQEISLRKEIECIKAGDKLPSKSSISSLWPVIDNEGILRVGGRIDKASIAYQARHQYIVPQKSRLSFLILKHAHEMTLHGGAQTMIQFIRRSFWIPKIRFEARNFIRTCTRCVRLAQITATQIMAELPAIRLRPAPPFQNVGVDLAGPYHMRMSTKVNANTRARQLPDQKGWIAVFVCLVTRAVHLEAVEGMSADDFLAAYTKFTSRRGNPEKIYSDNGTNLVGANSELKKAMKSWQSDQVQRYVHLKETEWHFITPSAPHEGGIWEAAVKQMKHHLKRVMGVEKYSFQGITTLLAGVEACLNSRPLCRMSDDPEDQEPLTPGHFLIGRPLRLPVYEKADAPPYSIKNLYMQLQFQIQTFWKKFSNDYIHSLSQLPKWKTEQENLKVGQLVVIKADNVAPTYWAMGRIMQIHNGSDGKVRSVLLRTQTGQLERSIRKICVLPADIENSYWK